MNIDDFVYIVETNKNFDETVISLLKSAEQKNWTLFQIYDIKERLAAKGFQHKELKIIELCSAKYANKLLNKNRLVSVCMPCRINILKEKDKTKIIAVKPTILTNFIPEITKEDTEELEKEIIEIIKNAK